MNLNKFAEKHKVDADHLYSFLRRFPVFDKHVTPSEISDEGMVLITFMGSDGFKDALKRQSDRTKFEVTYMSPLKRVMEGE